MEIVLWDQLRLLGGSVLLGGCAGMVYDLLRALRLRRRSWEKVLDLLYCLLCGAGVFLFVLQAADGVVQLYVVAGCGLGCMLYFTWLSQPLRPVWDLWVALLALLGSWMLLPGKKFWAFLKKIALRGKNLFLFAEKWGTIFNYKRTVVRMHRMGESAGMAKSTKSTKKRPKSKLLTKVVFLVLLVVLGTQLYRLQGQIQTAQEDQEQLTQQVEQLRQKNAELAQDIENGDDPALKEEIAREELGMVNPGEKVFYNVSD